MINSDLIKEGNELFQKIDHRDTHLSQDYSLKDNEGTKIIIEELQALSAKIPDIIKPTNIEEVYINELKRQCIGGIQILKEDLSPGIADPQSVLSRFNVKALDIEKLKDWLLTNKENVIKANINQYEKYSSIKKTDVPMGDPKLRTLAEEILTEYMEKIKKVLLGYRDLSNHFSDLFNDFHISIDSADRRSHANRVGKVALLSTSKFVYLSNKNIGVELPQLISIFGHEVLGHAANFYVTDKSDLPFFIKWGFSTLTSATRESVADFFERHVFKYISESTSINELFSSEKEFDEVYTSFKDSHYLVEYSSKIYRLGVWVLSQSKMDDTAKQIEEISKYSIDSKWPSFFVNRNKNEWNKSTGLLLPKIVSELKYCVDVVNDLEVSSVNKSDFDTKILEGMWSPQGILEKMSL